VHHVLGGLEHKKWRPHSLPRVWAVLEIELGQNIRRSKAGDIESALEALNGMASSPLHVDPEAMTKALNVLRQATSLTDAFAQ